MLLLRVEFPKRLEEGAAETIENFRRSEEFELTVALLSRSTLVSVFKRVYRDIRKVDAKFTLDKIHSMKDFLAVQAGSLRRRRHKQERKGQRAKVIHLREPLHPKARLHLYLQKIRVFLNLLFPKMCL